MANDAQRNDRLNRLAATASVTVAVVLVAGKFGAWLVTDSVSLLGSLADSSSDLLASLITFVSIRHAIRPADFGHRYGHGKAEALGALAQAAFITGSAVLLGFQAVRRLVNPEPVTQNLIGVFSMVAAMALTLLLLFIQRAVLKRTGSLAVRADSAHYGGDLLMNAAVIVALVVGDLTGWLLLDPLLGLAIVPVLLFSARSVAKMALDMLMDHELPDDDRRRIESLVRGHPDVRGMHDLRTRRSGADVFIEVHLELDGDAPLRAAHEICDAVELRIQEVYPVAGILIHAEPAGIDDVRLDARLIPP
jgi:ferrous-iron efflux pump FieF